MDCHPSFLAYARSICSSITYGSRTATAAHRPDSKKQLVRPARGGPGRATIVKSACLPGSSEPTSCCPSQRPRAQDRSHFAESRSSGTVGCRRTTASISAHRLRSGDEPRPSVPKATTAPAASIFSNGYGRCAEPIVAPRAVDRRHSLGVGREEADLLVVQVVAVDHQRTMGRGQAPQIFHGPSRRAGTGRHPTPRVPPANPEWPRPAAQQFQVPPAIRPGASPGDSPGGRQGDHGRQQFRMHGVRRMGAEPRPLNAGVLLVLLDAPPIAMGGRFRTHDAIRTRASRTAMKMPFGQLQRGGRLARPSARSTPEKP